MDNMYYRTNGEAYTEDYCRAFDSFMPVRLYSVCQRDKKAYIDAWAQAMNGADLTMFGQFNYSGMFYRVTEDDEEIVLIQHEPHIYTVIWVTGDSLEAMTRDIMRGVMEGF